MRNRILVFSLNMYLIETYMKNNQRSIIQTGSDPSTFRFALALLSLCQTAFYRRLLWTGHSPAAESITCHIYNPEIFRTICVTSSAKYFHDSEVNDACFILYKDVEGSLGSVVLYKEEDVGAQAIGLLSSDIVSKMLG